MGAALAVLGQHWKGIGLTLAAVALAGWVAWMRHDIASLSAEVSAYKAANAQLAWANAQLKATNAANQQICATAEAAAQQNLAIAKQAASAAQARAANYQGILHAIQAAPADHAPVSPVVRGAADSLWAPQPGH